MTPSEINLNLPSHLATNLLAWFSGLPQAGQLIVALSGGVDSAVVAKACYLAVGDRCTLATGDSPSLARQELLDAQQVANQIGAPHLIVKTLELEDANYQRNDLRRCYFCKSHLFENLSQRFPEVVILTGTNFDDLGDYRPGLQAANEHQIRAPLAELGYTKNSVRLLAEHWHLVVQDKPASPCLASRIAYGVEVTPERLARIEAAESFIRNLGLKEFRVRLHAGELARIEVPVHQIAPLADENCRTQILNELKRLGFRFVTLDLGGFVSGSLNQLIQIQASADEL